MGNDFDIKCVLFRNGAATSSSTTQSHPVCDDGVAMMQTISSAMTKIADGLEQELEEGVRNRRVHWYSLAQAETADHVRLRIRGKGHPDIDTIASTIERHESADSTILWRYKDDCSSDYTIEVLGPERHAIVQRLTLRRLDKLRRAVEARTESYQTSELINLYRHLRGL